MPFLDHNVVGLIARLPLNLKIHGSETKWILRRVLSNYVPQGLTERPKAGFSVSMDAWLREPLRDWAESLLDANRLKDEGFLDHEPIRLKWSQHLSGTHNWGYQLWDILVFQAWLEEQHGSASETMRVTAKGTASATSDREAS